MLRKITSALQTGVGTVTNRSRLHNNAIASRKPGVERAMSRRAAFNRFAEERH
jgi:hypothetical protein